MKIAHFISIDDASEDLILSFAIKDVELGVRSIVLQRAPQYEALLPAEERGVAVSLEGQPFNESPDILKKVTLKDGVVEISTQSVSYRVDISGVDSEEVKTLQPYLEKMNFDGSFKVIF